MAVSPGAPAGGTEAEGEEAGAGGGEPEGGVQLSIQEVLRGLSL